MKEKHHRGWWLWPGIVLLLIAVGIYARHSGVKQHRRARAPQMVGVAKVITGAMPETISALGTVTPTSTVVVVPELSGYLTKVGFTEGQAVAKGQFLAQIDPRAYQVQLALYRGQLAKDMALLHQAQSDLDRYEVLERKKSISTQQVSDQRFLVLEDQAALKIDRANIDTVKLDLTYCRITAPVAGRVGLRLVDPGNYVTPASSTGIAVITTLVPTTVVFSIPQTELEPVLERMRAGAKMTATAYASDDVTRIAEGRLTAVDNQVDTSTGTIKLRATFANTDRALFPNEFVNIHLLVKTLHHAILVPSPALQTGAQGSYVYRVKPDDTVTVEKVITGPANGTYTVITNGLRPGETVVTDGVDRLREGSRIAMADTAARHESAPGGRDRHRHGGPRPRR